MSVFTKRRKIARKKKEEQLKQLDKNIKQLDKSIVSMQLMIDTAKYIDENHPEFESLDEEERVLLFGKIYKELKELNGTE